MTLDTAYTRFLRRVLSWARFAGVDEADADDVAHDAFTAFGKAGHVIPDGCVKAWLRTTTRRMSRRHLAALALRRAREEEADELPAQLPSQEHAIGAREVEDMLLRLVDRLEPRRREVFRRHAIEGETMEQVATALRIPVNTAKKRYVLAREELQEAIERARARERRTARGSTSFALLPLLASYRLSRQALWIVALGAVPLGAGAVVLAVLLASGPELVLDAADAPAREDIHAFVAVVSFLEAPRELGAERGPLAREERPREALSVDELPELELVALARRALAEGSPARARGLLARADRAYPRGSLLPERAALAARATP
jgi:RNA polymerase sigma factor (sigma-70 family)